MFAHFHANARGRVRSDVAGDPTLRPLGNAARLPCVLAMPERLLGGRHSETAVERSAQNAQLSRAAWSQLCWIASSAIPHHDSYGDALPLTKISPELTPGAEDHMPSIELEDIVLRC